MKHWSYSYLGMLKSERKSLNLELNYYFRRYPDFELRKLAVESLKFLKNEELVLYLPQLLQALKYEHLNNSPLAKMLLECASKNIRFAHRLYW